MIPRFYGEVETNLGIGSVFDLILDPDGTPSQTLGYYLSTDQQRELYIDSLSNSLHSLKEYLLRQRIITMTLKPKNILCQKRPSLRFRLFLVDNMGNSDFISICNYSRYFAEKKIRRKWKRLEDTFLTQMQKGGAGKKIEKKPTKNLTPLQTMTDTG